MGNLSCPLEPFTLQVYLPFTLVLQQAIVCACQGPLVCKYKCLVLLDVLLQWEAPLTLWPFSHCITVPARVAVVLSLYCGCSFLCVDVFVGMTGGFIPIRSHSCLAKLNLECHSISL